MSIELRRLELSWIPFGPWEGVGPQIVKEFNVLERVTVRAGSGLYIDGIPYEVLEEDVVWDRGVKTGPPEGPFRIRWIKPYDPFFGHILKLRLDTDRGLFEWRRKFYLGFEKATVKYGVLPLAIGLGTIYLGGRMS